jgi:hypothetical protein
MEGVGGAASALARAVLAIAAFGLAVSGVVVGTEGSTFPGAVPSVALAPAAAVGCAATGPYRAPDPGSVGVPAALPLCLSGPMTVTAAGTVLDGWDVRGGIVVDAADVVVRRSRITGDGTVPFGIRTTDAGSVRIEDSTLTGDFPDAAIGGDRWSGERVEITGVTHDGARLGDGARLRNSSLHAFAPAPGAESHALVLLGSGSDILVEDNLVELGSGPRRGSAVLLAPEKPATRTDGPVLIRGNVLGGGRYTLAQDAAAALSEVRITGNRFQRDAGEGPLRVSRRAVLDGNTYLDGGLLPAR